ncbi:hypothetical protein [Streptomyces californicus]|uniref:hypothetical protein n=1 Tax=Streptomyces californicus TaxID=67351 RepID=UPI0036FD7C3D
MKAVADLTPTPDRPGLHVSKPSPNAPATGDSQVRALVESYTANHGAAHNRTGR